MILFRRFDLALVLGAAACASPHANLPAPSEAPVPVGLSPGDAVRVAIWRAPELSGEFMVAPEGYITFPLLGDRDVRGIPPADLEARIADEYRGFLENPSVTVSTLRRIAIIGAVRQPGLYSVDRTITLTDALAMAGGLGPAGDKNAIGLIRDGAVMIRSLDLSRTVTETSIRSGDQIEVGERSWFSRNTGVFTASILATASIVAAIIVSR